MMKKKKKINKNSNKRKSITNLTYQNRFITLGIFFGFLFLLIVCRLYVVMIQKKEVYSKDLSILTTDKVLGSSAPRGRILDRNGKIIVDNKALKTIYYQKEKNITPLEEVHLALEVAPHLDLAYSKLQDRNLREFYLAKYPEKAEKLIKDEEWDLLEMRKLTNQEIEKMKLDRISEDELAQLSEEDKKAAYLYYLMNQGYSYDEKLIKTEDVREEEYAYIAEHNKELRGFNTKLDWERIYPYGDVFKSILGTVSTSSQGIPYEEKEEYLKQGYALNDRVGLSYLEKQYEKYLTGKKEVYEVQSRHELSLVEEGSRGNDIVLTIDIELQKNLEQILSEEVVSAKSEVDTEYYNRSYALIQDPNNGEILAMAGKQVIPTNGGYEVHDVTTGILTSPMTVGSVVKGASMLTGYQSGAIQIGEYMVDECIKIAGTKEKCSWKTLGRINDLDALALSSNVYQFKTAIKVAGSAYQYNAPFVFQNDAFGIYHKMFYSFGLGVKTGIDLPVESLGTVGKSEQPGLLLDYVMGQYDTYTPIQLSQYISTLANGGTRYAPHLLKEVHQSSETEQLGDILLKYEPKVLNKVEADPIYFQRVKEGLHAVMHYSYGLGRNYIDEKYDASGKTGTSQSFKDTDSDGNIDKATVSTAFIGFAPSNQPKVTFTVTSPDSSHEDGPSGGYGSSVTKRITKRISDLYFSLYP